MTAEMTLRWHNNKSLLGYATAPGVVAGVSWKRIVFNPGQSMWELWWAKRQQDRFLSEYSCLSLSLSFYQCLVLTKSPITDAKLSQKLTASLSDKLKQGKLSENQITDISYEGTFLYFSRYYYTAILAFLWDFALRKIRNKINWAYGINISHWSLKWRKNQHAHADVRSHLFTHCIIANSH